MPLGSPSSTPNLGWPVTAFNQENTAEFQAWALKRSDNFCFCSLRNQPPHQKSGYVSRERGQEKRERPLTAPGDNQGSQPTVRRKPQMVTKGPSCPAPSRPGEASVIWGERHSYHRGPRWQTSRGGAACYRYVLHPKYGPTGLWEINTWWLFLCH